MNIVNKIKEKGKELSVLEGHDRLHYLIDIAKNVEELPTSYKIEENKIRGCASNLWVVGTINKDNTMKDVEGYHKALKEDKNFLAGLNVCKGKVTYKAVADIFGHEYVDPMTVI